ncbi:signal transduction histidine kinase/DNA-binding response OmpR family regulator/ligand-binding sensor domain-containing protein [Wenyingzhuangia heitensis]|uniref:histidine kinase n=1 Tax=Wenyingzhuangia heitensis TaxID=1487859 RepID=A0ABX0UAE4_9FLAO|nr:hybrid sensor histidine kinase/response regulator transcription factor [Wenyingzhuangia heitensis]NIJ45339.1 signal transduction histidine kinase/DNA-binding response OmpR family regulator/ligand-binding sensor domain-containing protein [Wenyingzhuangia heitensis]
MNKKNALILLFLVFTCVIFSQESKLNKFKTLNISNGLTHNGVTSIFEDSRGFVWIGTYDGLNKYDGFKIKQYKNTYKKEILTSNRVRCLNEDESGNLLIGTDKGLSIYNLETEEFSKIFSNTFKSVLKEPIIRSITIHPDTEEIICATEGEGLLVFNKDFSFQGQYHLFNSNNNVKRNIIFNGISLDNENYLFATSGYLLQFNIVTKKINFLDIEGVFSTSFINRLDEDTFYVGKNAGGVAFIDYKLINKKYVFTAQDALLKQFRFFCANIDYNNKLWLGDTRNGIVKIKDAQQFYNSKNTIVSDKNFSLEKTRMSTIKTFNKRYCWVGSFDNGVTIIDLKENPFRYEKLKLSNFLDLVPLSKNKFSLGATGDMLKTYDVTTKQYDIFEANLTKWERNKACIMLSDSRNDRWIGFSGGNKEVIARVKKGSSKVERILLSNKYQGGIKDVVEDKSGNIWVAYEYNIYKINIDTNGTFLSKESLKENVAFKNKSYSTYKYLYIDPLYNFLWIGDKVSGLLRVELKKEVPLKELVIDNYIADKHEPYAISNNFVTSIVRLPNNQLWIGTEGGGICKVENSNKTPKFIPFTEKEGLSNNVVKSIIADEDQNLWISTNIGLNKFDVKKNTFRSFTLEDGLPFEDFHYNSIKLSEDQFVFVGNHGFCYFNPKKIIQKEPLPRVEFGDFRIYNKVVKPRDTLEGKIVLQKHLTNGTHIELNHNQNVFSVEVVPLHYSSYKNRFIKYKLTPLHQNWIELKSGQNLIEFNGLQSGNYKLQVKASNSIQEWTTPKELKIEIHPEFWKSNIAYVLYVLFGFLIIYIVFQIFFKIQKLNHNLEIEQLEIDNLKDLNESKLRFFSNITHEIKTPVTLISGPVDFLLSKIKAGEQVDVVDKLGIVQRQSKRISQLIDQVNQFQKSDERQLKMNYETFCFDTFLGNLSTDFNFLAQKENKQLVINSGNNKTIYVSADKDKIEKVFNNLFSNSFKYTKAKDKIEINYYSDESNLIVSFKDTGKGISSEDLPNIFDRFYQSQRMTKEYIGGAGIGLAFSKRLVEMHYGYINADSEVGKGTEIHIKLPIIVEELDNQSQIEEVLQQEEKFEVSTIASYTEVDFSSIKSDETFAQAKIFYAEDNVDMRNFVTEMLSHFFEVKSYPNGAECLEALENEWPDIILSDVLMPELNGFELCKSVKSNIKTSHIPVVLLTACISTDEQIQGIEEGADAYIKKPFNTQQLVSTIESLLRNRKQLRERFKIDFPLELEKNTDSKKNMVFIEKLYDLILENLDNKDLDIDNLAKHLYLNRTHFYQKVKEITNQTPFELLKDFRLKKAAEFLVREKMTVNEVFVATGFKSRSHFSKVFKDKYNVTPGQFVKKGLDNLPDTNND